MGWVIVGGLLFLGIGLLSFFGRDWMWALTEWNNSWRGVASERTDNWELSITIGGIVAVLFGVALLAFGIVTSVNDARDASDATATATARLAALEATYVPIIPTLRADAGTELKRADAAAFDLPAEYEIFYGICSGNFFVYIDSGSLEGDFYTDANGLQTCAGQGWSGSMQDRLGPSSLGGTWGVGTFVNIGTTLPIVTATPTPMATVSATSES